MVWNAPIFSFLKNVSGIQILVASVMVRYLIRSEIISRKVLATQTISVDPRDVYISKHLSNFSKQVIFQLTLESYIRYFPSRLTFRYLLLLLDVLVLQPLVHPGLSHGDLEGVLLKREHLFSQCILSAIREWEHSIFGSFIFHRALKISKLH